MPFRQRDRRPGRLRRSGGFVKASGASVPSPSISVTGTTSVLIQFNSSDPSFTVLGISGPIHQQSEPYIQTTDLSPNLKGAAKIDSRQKGSIFALTPSFGALPSNGAAVIKNASFLEEVLLVVAAMVRVVYGLVEVEAGQHMIMIHLVLLLILPQIRVISC